jgi:hypothetical protein
MKVVSYQRVVPEQNSSYEKNAILTNFVQGVQKQGDNGVAYNGYDLQDCDVAIIQGWQHQRGKGGAHLQLRQKVIDTQIAKNRFVITADSNLFLYANRANTPYHYLRYSINGVFPNVGNYCDDKPDPKRWKQISAHTGIKLQDYQKKGRNIVLCLQRNGGWSMGTYDIQDWVIDTVRKIRKYSDRPIIVRPHPGDKKAVRYLSHRYNRIKNLPNVKLSDFGRPLEADLHKAWAVVNHNSSSIVGPIIQGYHAFITDPNKSQCAEVSNDHFKNIETPNEFNREQWLERISMFHWNFVELQNGSCWAHMRDYCK